MAVEPETETLPALAAQLRAWIPELKGRVVAVTMAEVDDKTSVPDLPLGLLAPIRQDYEQPNGGSRMTVVEQFLMEFWLPPEKEKTLRGGTVPFWAYYDMNSFRDKLFTHLASWRSPQNGTVRFLSFEPDANELATVLSFRMSATYDVCPTPEELDACTPDVLDDGHPIKGVTFNLCKPRSDCCPPQPWCEEEEEKNPCA